MKRWRDVSGGTVKDRRAALAEALRSYPNRTFAARALGINRQYLYELLMAYGLSARNPTPDTVMRPDTTDSTDTPDSVGSPDSTDTQDGRTTYAAVGTTSKDSLTYGATEPSLATTMSTAPATTETQDEAAEPTVRVNIDIPKSDADLLELWSVLDKQKSGASRASKSAVVVGLIRKRQAEGK